jgi:hypothetical protein
VRTFFVWAIVFLSLPIAFFQPFYGVLIWAWTSYFRPHDLAWGAGDLRLSYYIALATLGGVLFSRERFRIIPVRETFLCGALLVALMIAADHAEFSQGYAWEKVQQYGKVLLMTVLTAALVTSPGRFRILAWTIAISVGGLGFKGGLLGTIRGARLAGPGGFIADNNDFALALNMSLPFFLYLAQQSKRRFVKLALYFVFALSVIAIVLTYSRGGFIGLGMVMFMIWLRSKRKFVSEIVIVASSRRRRATSSASRGSPSTRPTPRRSAGSTPGRRAGTSPASTRSRASGPGTWSRRSSAGTRHTPRTTTSRTTSTSRRWRTAGSCCSRSSSGSCSAASSRSGSSANRRRSGRTPSGSTAAATCSRRASWRTRPAASS